LGTISGKAWNWSESSSPSSRQRVVSGKRSPHSCTSSARRPFPRRWTCRVVIAYAALISIGKAPQPDGKEQATHQKIDDNLQKGHHAPSALAASRPVSRAVGTPVGL